MVAAISELIQQLAQRPDPVGFQLRIVANIAPIEMDVVDLRVFPVFVGEEAAQERLAELVTAAGGPTAKLDPALAQRFFDAAPEVGRGGTQHEGEGVIAAPCAL